MNAAKQAAWLFCILIMLACSGWYFASSPSEKKLDTRTLANTIDEIIEGLKVRKFNPQGSLTHVLESESMFHIPNHNTHYLKFPHIIVQEDKNKAAWEIHAERAEALNKGKQITFLDKVTVHQNKTESSEESKFSTEKLLYFPQKKFASSDVEVVFEQQGSVVHSKGMNAYLEEKHVELLGRTQLIYYPKKVHHA